MQSRVELRPPRPTLSFYRARKTCATLGGRVKPQTRISGLLIQGGENLGGAILVLLLQGSRCSQDFPCISSCISRGDHMGVGVA